MDTCVDTFIERFTSGLKKSGSNKGNVRVRTRQHSEDRIVSSLIRDAQSPRRFSLFCRCARRSVVLVQVCLGFHEKSVKKNFFGFGAKEEKVYWERWIIPITATNDKEKQTSQAGAAHTTATEAADADAERRMGKGMCAQ